MGLELGRKYLSSSAESGSMPWRSEVMKRTFRCLSYIAWSLLLSMTTSTGKIPYL